MQIKDKVVIVTGASSGIGLATAKLLTEKGARVALVARSKPKLDLLAKELEGSLAIPTDMLDEKEIMYMVEKVHAYYGRIDILVNNAGRGYHLPIEQLDRKKVNELFTLNVLGPLTAMQQVIPIMKKQKEGAIVNISSGTSLMYIPGIAAYSASKRALNAFSLTAREELQKDNIAVSVVYPYITKTNFHKNLLNGDSWDMDEQDDLPSFDTPEHVAEKILEAIESGKPEVFAHDWMDRSKK